MGATMKDIAKRTGLGLATISSYLNGGNVREKNRIKIEEAIRELHFEVNEVARGLKTNRTKTIGIVIPELNNIFFAEIITEAEDILRSHGYATMICDCRSDTEREKEAVDFLYHRRVDGLIVMPTGTSDPGFQKFIRAGKPIVMIDRKMKDVCCDCILVDNEGAAEDAVNRLVRAGHRKIGMIAGPEDVYTARERQRGYEKALRENNAVYEEGLMARGNYTIAGGAKAMRQLWENNPDMTAVFISNYEMTVGAMMEINDLGIRVPDELSVIGFDNVDFAKASVPRLSIVTQPTAQIAQEAADTLIEKLQERDSAVNQKEDGQDRKKTTVTVTLKTGFVEGRSVKASEKVS
ncbi:LacI family DNA-binding transcriptional regulator [Mediterraneibacter glycyrrhizinilyticus]|uniref:LacI family DNA-binding transcriptional regulator n=1 Tax=Mediterraneibacter glycyrrhizinilyticus TaxID=342942 RepID=UPI000B399ED6|nr:LacI family DNA-binding transcriptional regulator [Mediterraneibacter glycyrrhizinilyticus]MCF2568718.1 LacI family DNA-binding transcriptional regulator [Mediterraneibacter glycyrrhizinilyticus]OUO24898.1 LacI family transcriptional regulator [Lachnoclostridium sp. An298]